MHRIRGVAEYRNRFIACAAMAFVLTMRVAPAAEPEKLHAAVNVDAARVVRDAPPLWLGHNMEWVWQGQGLFKADGTAKDGVAPLLQALKPGLIRYPGGSLANSFRWADSVGPAAERKPICNFFTIRGKWQDKVTYSTEKPLIGFDEFMKFVEQTGAKGAIVIVNCTVWPKNPELSGSAQEAAAWVAYANTRVGANPAAIGPDKRGIDWKDSAYWAALRAKNGHPAPYNVTHWEIGNEVYDTNQGAGVTGPDYAARAVGFTKVRLHVHSTWPQEAPLKGALS